MRTYTRPHFRAISSLGLQTFDNYVHGSSVLWRDNSRFVYAPDPATRDVPRLIFLVLLKLEPQRNFGIIQPANWMFLHIGMPLKQSNGTAYYLGPGFMQLLHFLRLVFYLTPPPLLFLAESPELSLLCVDTYISAAGQQGHCCNVTSALPGSRSGLFQAT